MKNQNDLIISIVAIVIALIAAGAVYGTKPTPPPAPAAPTKVDTSEPKVQGADVKMATALPGAGTGGGTALAGGVNFGARRGGGQLGVGGPPVGAPPAAGPGGRMSPSITGSSQVGGTGGGGAEK